MPLANRVLALAERKSRALDLAQDRWREIFLSMGIAETHLVRPNRPCPLCGGRDRFSFTNHRRRGSYLCRKCGSGDGFDLIMRYTNCSFTEALERVEQFCGFIVPHEPSSAGADKNDPPLAEHLKAWAQASPVRVTDEVHTYLKKRGLAETFCQTEFSTELRYHRGMPYHQTENSGHGAAYPVMLARVTDRHGVVVNMHRTYLDEGAKAPVDSPKKLMKGAFKGAVVQLHPVTSDLLGYAEGIETALAAHELFSMPVWAALSAGNLAELDWVPDGVKRVRVFADNDESEVGQFAAINLARQLILRGLEVEVWIPTRRGWDFLDVRNALMQGSHEKLFYRL